MSRAMLDAAAYAHAKKTAAKKAAKEPGRNAGHFIPITQQSHLGKPGVPLCGAPVIEPHPVGFGCNTIENTVCPECRKAHRRVMSTCRVCGAMITPHQAEYEERRCTRCRRRAEETLGLVDVDSKGRVVAAIGAAKGKEVEAQKTLDEEREAKYKGNRSTQLNTGVAQSGAPQTKETDMAKTKATKAAAPKAAEGGARAEKRAMKIKMLSKESPHREGAGAQKHWDLVVKSKTVGDFLDAGGDSGYLAFYVKKGLVALQ